MIKILLASERLWSLKNLISITYHIIGDYMLSKQFNSTSFLRTKKKNSKKTYIKYIYNYTRLLKEKSSFTIHDNIDQDLPC